MDNLKNPKTTSSIVEEIAPVFDEVIEVVPTEEVTHFAEIMPIEEALIVPDTEVEVPIPHHEKKLSDLSKDELFEKLNNYKKLLDNGLILQGEYDKLKNEILPLL